MDTALPQKFPYILDRNLAKASGTENHVCTSCDKVVLDFMLKNTYLLSTVGNPHPLSIQKGTFWAYTEEFIHLLWH